MTWSFTLTKRTTRVASDDRRIGLQHVVQRLVGGRGQRIGRRDRAADRRDGAADHGGLTAETECVADRDHAGPDRDLAEFPTARRGRSVGVPTNWRSATSWVTSTPRTLT